MTEKRSAPHEPSCVGLAVKIIDALKGSGRIIWVEIKVLGEEPTGHAYVVPNKARGGKYPLNEPKYRYPGQERMTIKEVLKRGIDRTEEF